MEFDWSAPPFPLKDLTIKEIEETFEDPFAIRLLPEDLDGGASRYCILGRAVTGRGIFGVFRTDGKIYRVIAARPMTDGESHFYDRKNAEMNG